MGLKARKRIVLHANASSSFKILIASDTAEISSARIFCRSANSFFFIAQVDARFATKASVSFISAVVSSMSSAVVVTDTARLPERTVLDSMASELAWISLVFAAASSSKPRTGNFVSDDEMKIG